jgi:hypothetical protein
MDRRADSNKLIADHPEIANHLARRRSKRDIVMIPYGADPVTEAPEAPVRAMGLNPWPLSDLDRSDRAREQHPADDRGVRVQAARPAVRLPRQAGPG